MNYKTWQHTNSCFERHWSSTIRFLPKRRADPTRVSEVRLVFRFCTTPLKICLRQSDLRDTQSCTFVAALTAYYNVSLLKLNDISYTVFNKIIYFYRIRLKNVINVKFLVAIKRCLSFLSESLTMGPRRN